MITQNYPNSASRPGRSQLFRLVSKALNRSDPGYKLQVNADYSGSRRNFLRSVAALTATYATPILADVKKENPRIAIVGAGIAGLNAAYVLRQAGYQATVYEASQRIGGRIRTSHGDIAPGLITELGGEFIDSTHLDMLALAKTFGLPLLDTGIENEHNLKTMFFFNKRCYSEEQVIAEFRPLAIKIASDAARLSSNITARAHSNIDAEFDAISLSEYLHEIGATGWILDLINVAYVTEYGLDASELSCINLLSMIDATVKDGFKIFGESDQRFKIQGGNNRIIDELAQRIGQDVQFGHRLVSIRPNGKGFRLALATPGKTISVDSDWVILTLPFTLLREVEMGDMLPPIKRSAVRTLGYGTNTKLVVGVDKRIWREQGYSGECYSDKAFQTGWDASRLQAGPSGVYTFYLGGKAGIEIGDGTTERRSQELSAALDQVYPGFNLNRTNASFRIHWPSEPFSLGAYSCFRLGQWTQFNGEIGRQIGNLLFAGEHCSNKFQGYMNGAAETGRIAAQAIINSLR
ncbi:flavin monoamine oxidase family protein [Nitrosospira lacus]|uniref:flavin monoamine oxidase family protein n=1 Tax=Nitrosospira lacus TaxID=1288494 RepID=UPI0002C53FE6|nr:FAD-dependent oxidoreductase [Nitrosospira lacus]